MLGHSHTSFWYQGFGLGAVVVAVAVVRVGGASVLNDGVGAARGGEEEAL